MELRSGTTIRDYRLISRLGEGGMGEVWLAEDINIERKIALKVLSSQLVRDSSLVERFRQEAKILANLLHPNIVTCWGFFSQDQDYYLAMEYAPGINLKTLISQTGPLPYQRAVHILRQILEALAHTHSKGIIHRDIKPSNIMIDTANNDMVKVMDFGIAKALADFSMTRTGMQIGTLYYMSPEQINDSKSVDHRSDIFSLGILFYEMLTGRIPYDTDTDSSYKIQHAILTEQLPSPLTIYPYIPKELITILDHMCEKDMNTRYQNVNGIISDLAKVSSPSPEPVTLSRMPNRQNQVKPELIPLPEKQVRQSSGKKTNPLVYIIPAVILIAALLYIFVLKGKDKPVADKRPEGMVEVAGGSYLMGSQQSSEADEMPQHQVSVDSFWMSETEVTQQQWMAIMGFNPSYTQGDSLPVEQVTWFETISYCNKLSLQEGLTPCYSIDGNTAPANWQSNRIVCDFDANGYRLPTEAEWEFAAKGGNHSSGFKYSGSNDPSIVAWSSANSGGRSHPVKTLSPNELGLYDMSGNIEEWCWDWYSAFYYKNSSSSMPRGPESGSDRSIRGGCWKYEAIYTKHTNRAYETPDNRDSIDGFRVVRSIGI